MNSFWVVFFIQQAIATADAFLLTSGLTLAQKTAGEQAVAANQAFLLTIAVPTTSVEVHAVPVARQ